jgi:PAS domain S-box-containing protein
MKIKTRLKLNSFISLGVLILILLSLAWSFREMSIATRNLDQTAEMRKTAFERIILRDDYLLNQEERARTQWIAKSEALRRLLESASEIITDSYDQALLKEARRNFDITLASFSKFMEDRQREGRAAKGGFVFNDAESRLIGQVFINAYALNDNLNRLYESASKARTTARDRGLLAVIVAVIGGILASIINTALTNRILTKRIEELGKGVELIGSGDLDYRIMVEGDDELTALALAINEMTVKLGRSYTAITDLEKEIELRRRSEKSLRESELKYRTVANNTYDWEHWKRPDGSFYYVSPSCERISGYSPDDFLAEPGLMKRIIIPEDAGIFEAHTRHDVEQMKVGETEFRIRAKDGSTRWISHNCLPVFDDAGVYIGTRGTNRDITGRKRMAEALAIQARIATIFLTVPDDEIFNGVLKEILDIMQSPIGVFGYIDEAGALVVPTMTWQIWDKCRVPEKTVRFPREEWGCSSWPRAIREKRAIHCNEPSINIPEGHVGIQRHISLPIQFRGEVIGLFQVANKESDYTEADIRTLEEIARHVASILNAQLDRLRAEERLKLTVANLERSNKELEQFAYIASHDLQEPLRMVASYTQLLAQRYEGQLDDKAKKYIDYAVDGAGRMQRLINDLLDYSRVNRFGKPPETVDSHSSLGEALRNLSAAIEENRAIVINEDLPMVRADATQLCQLFQNLISNAIKFRGAESPRIQVSASDLGREWRFSVKDNGIGIDAQYADKVFVIFQRLHTRQEYSGTGIGLAICNRIVERHGGRIWFDSEPGKGSTFYFTLPK